MSEATLVRSPDAADLDVFEIQLVDLPRSHQGPDEDVLEVEAMTCGCCGDGGGGGAGPCSDFCHVGY
ncbi:MAG TPA: hypothetical protein VKV34_00570 [Thermoleophilia bacterium]|jgi:hypothetical protein|nr:hypothetical protein [Thermoleophilia bacterium]